MTLGFDGSRVIALTFCEASTKPHVEPLLVDR
jgi:hypothetical protein